MKTSTAEFLQKLRQFVQREADAQYRALQLQWAQQLQERVARGWAIEGLRVEQFKNNIARLVCVTNSSRFREGDLVVLHRGNPYDDDAQHCELQYDGETDLDVSIIRGNEIFHWERGLKQPLRRFYPGLQCVAPFIGSVD